MFLPRGSLRFTHHVKIDQQLLKRASKEYLVTLAWWASRFVNLPNTPCMHWRIHIAKVPFVGRDLAAGVHVPLTQK